MRKIYFLPVLILLNTFSVIAQNDYNYLAPVFYKRCTSCHHVNYSSTVKRIVRTAKLLSLYNYIVILHFCYAQQA